MNINYLIDKKKYDYILCNNTLRGTRGELITIDSLNKLKKIILDLKSTEYLSYYFFRKEKFKSHYFKSKNVIKNENLFSISIDSQKDLSNIREMNALLHVVRCFDDENVVHVDGAINPLKDLETINLELIFADLEVLEKRHQKLEKLIRSGDEAAKRHQVIIHSLKELMENGNLPTLDKFDAEEIKFIESMNLLSTKPTVLIANLSDDESKNNLNDLENYGKANAINIIPAVMPGWSTEKPINQSLK